MAIITDEMLKAYEIEDINYDAKKEKAHRKKIDNQYKGIGCPVGYLDESDSNRQINPYRLKAMILIEENKPLSKTLLKNMYLFDKKNNIVVDAPFLKQFEKKSKEK